MDRATNWQQDSNLRDRLTELVRNCYKQMEAIEFLRKEFSQYSWSRRTLQRRLQHFGIKSQDKSVDPETLIGLVQEEIKGTGALLGIRALHHKIRNSHGLLVTRRDVHLAMNLVCPNLPEDRRLTNNRKKFKKRVYVSKGPNWTWSIDGHDKLSGRFKSELPFGIHGGIDSFSRKVLWLVIWPSNCNPLLPARLFYDAIVEHSYAPCRTWSDRGSENVTVATIQNFLTEPLNGWSNHIFGSSMTNQVIEQWWKGFRERHGEYFKSTTNAIIRSGYYNETNSTCRVVMAAVFIPLIQDELNTFKNDWNTHRIRRQNIYRPCGIPNYLYSFPEQNGGQQCGVIPDISKMEFMSKQVKPLRLMRFLSTELENEITEAIDSLGIESINLSNAADAYVILMNHFINRELEFEFS